MKPRRKQKACTFGLLAVPFPEVYRGMPLVASSVENVRRNVHRVCPYENIYRK
jgi:hypothetical protein